MQTKKKLTSTDQKTETATVSFILKSEDIPKKRRA